MWPYGPCHFFGISGSNCGIPLSAHMSIDKITLGIDAHLLNYRKTPECLHQMIDVITYGDYSELNFQGEYIDARWPLWSIARMLHYAAYIGLFEYSLSCFIYNETGKLLAGTVSLDWFFRTLCVVNDLFKLDEYEIAFDFFGDADMLPFQITNHDSFREYGNSIYSKDYRIQRRDNGKKKGITRSLLCIYDRGRKLLCNAKITRLEFRICDKRAKAILDTSDLMLPLESLILQKGTRIQKTLHRYVPTNAIVFDKCFVEQYIPYLPELLDCTYQ